MDAECRPFSEDFLVSFERPSTQKRAPIRKRGVREVKATQVAVLLDTWVETCMDWFIPQYMHHLDWPLI